MRNKLIRKRDWIDIKALSKKCRQLGIATNTQYLKRYKEIPGAPLNLPRTYKDYNTWYEFIRIGAKNESLVKLKSLGIYHL